MRYQRNGFRGQILQAWTAIRQQKSAHDSQQKVIASCLTVAPREHGTFHAFDRCIDGLLPKDFLGNGIAHDVPSCCREVGEIAEHIANHIDLMAVMTQAMSQLLWALDSKEIDPVILRPPPNGLLAEVHFSQEQMHHFPPHLRDGLGEIKAIVEWACEAVKDSRHIH